MEDQWSDIDEENLKSLLARKRRVEEMWDSRWEDLTRGLCSFDNSQRDVIVWLKENSTEIHAFLSEWRLVSG